MIETLDNHRQRILAHLAYGETLLTPEPSRDLPGLLAARTELARALGAYGLFKHGSIFYPLINGNGTMADQARRMKLASQTLAEDYRAYQVIWDATDVVAVWRDYQPAARAMVDRVRRHINGEYRGLVELIKAAGIEAAAPVGYGAPSRRSSAPVIGSL